MNITLEKVFERDVDLLIINKFANDKNFKNLFLNKLNLDNHYEISDIEHSMTDENGESDITVILKNNSEKIGLLIEDKIDAIAMPNQRERYNLRGEKGIKANTYSKYFVFMVAPLDYLKTNKEAKKYENQISYEELLQYFKQDAFAYKLLEQALEEKQKGYIVIENNNVTQFWQKYYQYIKQNCPTLKINEVEGPRGSSAVWPEIKTPVAKINIIHKSDRGFLDLTFPKMGEHLNIFQKYVAKFLDDEMIIEKTNKSAAIRIKVPIIDFKNNFDDYLPEIKLIMEKATKLRNLVLQVDIKNMYDRINQR